MGIAFIWEKSEELKIKRRKKEKKKKQFISPFVIIVRHILDAHF